jgi:hypothetical protein
MSTKINIKPMTIKEYAKNYKYQNKKPKNKEKENLNKSQNILLNKILKNKKVNGNISMDSSINKTIENALTVEENKKKVLNYLKNKNHEIPKTSIPSPSKNHERDSSPSFFSGNNKKYINKEDNYDSYLTHKNYNNNNKTETNSRKIISNYKATTPIDKNKNNLNNSVNRNILNGLSHNNYNYYQIKNFPLYNKSSGTSIDKVYNSKNNIIYKLKKKYNNGIENTDYEFNIPAKCSMYNDDSSYPSKRTIGLKKNLNSNRKHQKAISMYTNINELINLNFNIKSNKTYLQNKFNEKLIKSITKIQSFWRGALLGN